MSQVPSWTYADEGGGLGESRDSGDRDGDNGRCELHFDLLVVEDEKEELEFVRLMLSLFSFASPAVCDVSIILYAYRIADNMHTCCRILRDSGDIMLMCT